MSIDYNQMDQEWWLCNSNYHRMVQIMIEIVRNGSSLRFEAPVWCPGGEKQLQGTKVKNKVNDAAQYVANNEEINRVKSVAVERNKVSKETKETDDWIKPKKVCMPRNTKENENMSDENSYGILTDYESEEEDELSEGEPEQCGKTREQLHNEVNRLENVLKMNEEIYEQKFLENYEQMKYYKGESQARNEIIEILEKENDKL